LSFGHKLVIVVVAHGEAMLEVHWIDLLTCCTTNPQQIDEWKLLRTMWRHR